MTFQPPPPPPGGNPPPPPPPPPPGQWGPPPGGGYPAPRGFDPKNVNPLDWALIGIGFLVFLFSFIDFYSGADITCGGRTVSVGSSGSASAWHEIFGGGFFAWFAMLFGLAGGVLIAMELFAPQVKLPMANRVAALGLLALAALFEIIAIFVTPGIDGSLGGCSASINHGFGFWLSLILLLGGTVLALMRAQQTGAALPGPLANMPNIGAKGPQGGIGGNQGGPGMPPPPPPPPPGYGPPPTG
jgi:hypothetical protein